MARILQGVGGALLTPGSLAMIQGAFAHDDRGRAIGAWSGLGGVAAADRSLRRRRARRPRLLAVDLPDQPAARASSTVVIALRSVPETRDPTATGHFDVMGAVLASLALGGITYALIEWGSDGALWAGAAGVIAAVAFLVLGAASSRSR